MWSIIETQHGLQILPDDDIVGHYADGLCLCVPTRRYEWNPGSLSNGGWVVTHNAYDGRERAEGSGQDSLADTLMAWQLGEMV